MNPDEEPAAPCEGCEDCVDGTPCPPQEPRQLELPPTEPLTIDTNIWADGACKGNPGPIGLGVVIKSASNGEQKSVRYSAASLEWEEGTNNIAEYLALLEALELTMAELTPILQSAVYSPMRPDTQTVISVTIHMDSELVVKQVSGEYAVKDETLQKFHAAVMPYFENMRAMHINVALKWVPREQNGPADALADSALSTLKKEW